MPKAYKGSHSLVLAAVKVGDENHLPLRAAAQMCRRTGMRLRLVTVIETGQRPGIRYTPYDMFDFTALDRARGDELRAKAANDLHSLADTLEIGAPVETSVIVGDPAQGILSDAVVSGASLIVVGAAKGGHRFVPKGMSTALSLMADSSVPVLVVNDACTTELGRKSLKILVADDLSESCERAVLVAFDLAVALGHTDVHHVHANALNMETIADTVQRMRKSRERDSDKDLGPTELWDAAQRDLHERIRSRAPIRSLFLETSGGTYRPEIRNGGAEAELDKAIETAAPDLLVFGRHQSIHRRPFAIGRVPFHFMLSQNKAVLIVPPN